MDTNKSKYKVVINHEEQYSIIPADQKLSRDYREVGVVGTKSSCLDYIEEVWTDMKAIDRERILRSLK